MALTRRRIAAVLSLIYLLALVIVAGYALHSTRRYSLPIPNLLSGLTLALPPLAGISLETQRALRESLSSKKSPLLLARALTYVVGVLLIYEAVLATLAGTHLAPVGGLDCGLRERWQRLFSAKSDRIRGIQDAFNCCGFQGVKDMPFPFPDARHKTDSCVVRYERDSRCLEPWRDEERKVAVMLLVVPIAVFLWQVIILALPTGNESWLPSSVTLPIGDGESSTRRQIAYRDVEDRAAVANEDASLTGEVARLNSDSQLASQVEGGRVQSSALLNERNEWRGDRDRA